MVIKKEQLEEINVLRSQVSQTLRNAMPAIKVVSLSSPCLLMLSVAITNSIN